MSFYFKGGWRFYTAITACVGWIKYKRSGTYGARYYSQHDELLLGCIPGVNLLFIPFVTGHILATMHDKLLYKMNPLRYQKLVEDYEKSLKLYLESKWLGSGSSIGRISGGGTGGSTHRKATSEPAPF